ncbi:hypothetical protein SLEP1_g21324 [Rubroshorea leprosula]|uniref:TF-B3 domain-containing protein n=1 Tax=Rubroshorea leprosula TaxID=152421 RepID=A0AAV5JAZ5_9ROSI|nr:hypothetical protein SLEP1_g21324 [Rubroshorea leprosula]
MAEEKVEVSSQTLSESSLEKLTLPQDVLQHKMHLLPPELSKNGPARADLTLLKDGSEEILSVVTVSRQAGPRLVLLQKGWKTIVKELGLIKGDKVSIFLVDGRAWTYSIQVEKSPTAKRHADTSRLQVLADCAVKMMEETSNRPALRPSFDLNQPPMDTELLQVLADCAVQMMEESSNRPALRPSFDLNQPPMETEL